MKNIDKKRFFNEIRKTIFSGKLSQSQVDGIEDLFYACEQYGVISRPQIAYVLATPVIETGGKFQPIEENLRYSAHGLRRTFKKYFTPTQASQYAYNPKAIANRAYANRMENGPESSGDGWKFRGRGDVQITGRRNYRVFSKILNLDLIKEPDLALVPDISKKIAVVGMQRGIFTGRKLDDYINSKSVNFIAARRIINGTDKARKIAQIASRFDQALKNAEV